MRQFRKLFVYIVTGLALATQFCIAQGPPQSQPYVWKSVQMVGGGFVDGIVFHPTAKDVCYARTDIGGAYRWDARAKRWQPILDWLPLKDTNLMGVESIALDPKNGNKVYLACANGYMHSSSPNAAILRSDDRARTFHRADLPFKMGGNENGRGNGERLSVDPNDGRVLFFGSRHDGLWRSGDGAATWKKVDTFPAGTDPGSGFGGGAGIVAMVVDPASGGRGHTSSTVYAAECCCAINPTSLEAGTAEPHGPLFRASPRLTDRRG